MPGTADIPLGNIQLIMLLQSTLSPAIVNTISVSEQTFTVQGLQLGDIVSVTKPTAQPGLGVTGARVSAPNTLAITFVNPTVAGITPTANEVYIILMIRRENPGAILPGALV